MILLRTEYISKDEFMGGSMVIRMPNITNIVYGRDVGYNIEEVRLSGGGNNEIFIFYAYSRNRRGVCQGFYGFCCCSK